MHRQCLRAFYHYVSNNPPSSPCLCVTFPQTLNTNGKPYHSKFLKSPYQLKFVNYFRAHQNQYMLF